jgi:trehalose 6-phosphate synthase
VLRECSAAAFWAHPCNNFLDAVDRFLEARVDREQIAVIHQARRTLVRPYPISIEWPSHWLKDCPPPGDCRAEVLAELNLSPDTLLGVGVDRLDYTKNRGAIVGG